MPPVTTLPPTRVSLWTLVSVQTPGSLYRSWGVDRQDGGFSFRPQASKGNERRHLESSEIVNWGLGSDGTGTPDPKDSIYDRRGLDTDTDRPFAVETS